MKKLVPVALVIALMLARFFLVPPSGTKAPERRTGPVATSDAGSRSVEQAVEGHLSDVQVQGFGTVVKILPDDTKGIRHQQFLLRLGSGDKILIAHNIDLAPKIEPLRVGDTIEFSGEFEWNDKGGVVHWTHRDPSGRHHAGWLKHDGEVFE
jgi:hypothetical protein